MQFRKIEVGNVQSDIWWNTLKELADLNGWSEIDFASVIESHNDLVEIYEHCKEVIEQRYGEDIADLPFLEIYCFGIRYGFEWDFINTVDDDGGMIKEQLIEGAKYDGFDSFYLIDVPLTDSVKTQLSNFKWVECGDNEIVTEYDENIPVLLLLAVDNARDFQIIYTHKED